MQCVDRSASNHQAFEGLLPTPSRLRKQEHWVSPPAVTMTKAALYIAMGESGITKVQLAKRLGVNEKEVRRLLDPHYVRHGLSQ